MKAAMARLSQGPDETQTPCAREKVSLHSQECESPRAAMRVIEKGVTMMMRPDHIWMAMTMVKHGTLAGAFIFAIKILRFAVTF